MNAASVAEAITSMVLVRKTGDHDGRRQRVFDPRSICAGRMPMPNAASRIDGEMPRKATSVLIRIGGNREQGEGDECRRKTYAPKTAA